MAVQHVRTETTRGRSRSIPFAVPLTIWTAGCSIFFTVKPRVDDDRADQSAVIKKTFTDADIVTTDAVNVNYLLVLDPSDTYGLDVGWYVAEFEYVSVDVPPIVLSFPDPTIAIWDFGIVGDVTRRVS